MMKHNFFFLTFAFALSWSLSAQTLIIPDSRLTSVNEGRTFTVGVLTGAQDLIFMGQPEKYQIESFFAFGYGHYEMKVAYAGLNTEPYGAFELRRQVLTQEENLTNLTIDFQATMPSHCSSGIGIRAVIGQDTGQFGWTAGLFGGIISAPSPNQGPLGVNGVLYALGGVQYRLIPVLTLNLELSVSPFLSNVFTGIQGHFGPVTIKVMEPVNFVHYQEFNAMALIPAVEVLLSFKY